MNKILLIDMDNFFSSVEELKFPNNNLPLVVAGHSNSSVISSCNAKAKKLGIRSAMPIQTALKICPNLIIVPVDIDKYINYSKKIYSILKRFTCNIESSSIDEWYLDLSKRDDFFSRSTKEIAESIKYEVYKTLNLKCSIGISYNKFLAKMACEKAKPFGIYEITKENFKESLWNIPIDDMYMVGKSTAKILKKYNINTIGDLANCNDKKELRVIIGKLFDYIYNNANGKTIDYVDSDYQRKSISSGFTIYNIVMHTPEYNDLFNYHFEKIYEILINNKFLTDSISVYVTINHVKKWKSKKLNKKTNDRDFLYNSLYDLMNSFNIKSSFDAFGLSLNNLTNEFEELDKPRLFDKDASDNIINIVNKSMNKNVINVASVKLKK